MAKKKFTFAPLINLLRPTRFGTRFELSATLLSLVLLDQLYFKCIRQRLNQKYQPRNNQLSLETYLTSD